jgi:hypothetical protein
MHCHFNVNQNTLREREKEWLSSASNNAPEASASKNMSLDDAPSKTHPNQLPSRPPYTWPSTIVCEMDIQVWERELEKAGLRDKYNNVILGFKEGFDQGIPPHRMENRAQFFTPDNHQLAIQAKEKIKNNIHKKVAAGCMTLSSSGQTP